MRNLTINRAIKNTLGSGMEKVEVYGVCLASAGGCKANNIDAISHYIDEVCGPGSDIADLILLAEVDVLFGSALSEEVLDLGDFYFGLEADFLPVPAKASSNRAEELLQTMNVVLARVL